MRKTVLSALTAALMLAAPAAIAQDIVIAVAGPMTGQYASFGEQMRRGAEMAVKHINAQGGVMGRQLKLELGDEHDLLRGELVGDRAKFNKVFRVCGRDDQQGRVGADWVMEKHKGKVIAVVHDQTQYGKGLADFAKARFNEKGVKEAMYEAVSKGTKDFSALISRMKQAKVDVIYYGGYHNEAGLLIRQAKEQQLNAVLVGGDALVTQEFWSITGKSGEGAFMTFDADPRKNPIAAKVVAEFKQQGYEPEGYTLYTYAAIQIFKAAVEKAKSTKLDDLAKTLRSTEFDTMLGKISFDAKGDVTSPAYRVYAWADGKYDYAK